MTLQRLTWILLAVDFVAAVIYTLVVTRPTPSYGPGMSGLGNALIGVYAAALVVTTVLYAVTYYVAARKGWKRTTIVLTVLLLLGNTWALLVIVSSWLD